MPIASADECLRLIWHTLPDGRFEFANSDWGAFTGLSWAESCGDGWRQTLHPDDFVRWLAARDAANSNGLPFVLQCRLHRADGVSRWFRVRTEPVHDARGQLAGWLGTATALDDGASRQPGAEPADAHRADLSTIVESTDDAVLAATLAGVITSWNAGAEQLYGYTAIEMIGQPVQQLAPLGRTKEIPALLARLAEGVSFNHFETQRRTKSGVTTDVSLTLSPIRDRDGQVVGASSVARDIGERKRMEAALDAAQGQLRAVVSRAPITLTAWNSEGRVTLSEGRGLASIGLQAGHAVGEYVFERGSEQIGYVTRTLAGESFQVEFEFAGRRYEARYEPLRDVDGSVVGALNIGMDVTDRARAKETERGRLVAETANRAKSEFLSRMSHELRTPLNAILGFAYVLETSDLTVDQREALGFISKGGQHLLELINEVLDLSRIEAGRFPLSPEPVALGTAIREALDLIRPLTTAQQIDLRFADTPAQPQWVTADHQRLKQVFLNLLSNAVKYNQHGGSVEVTTARTPEGRVRIMVQDTGNGIAVDCFSRLFTPFDRLGAEGGAIEGTGLGLALSKRLVETMGGAMGAESTEGVGSTFWLELAAAEEPGQLNQLGGTPEPSAAQPMPTRTVLYIEDNLSNLALIERLLAPWRHVNLLSAIQGQLGIDLAREHRPDLILLDLHLPDIPGDQILGRLKAEPGLRDIPVLVISADATYGQVSRLLAEGAAAYFTKPLDIPRFLAAAEQLLTTGRIGPTDDA